MKNKAIALMGAIVLCSLFFVALSATAIAAEEDDYVLDIYGNANEDDTIDMRDLTYVKRIFFGKKPETELADAKYDGKINPLDFIQIKLIIVGKEKELTLVDQADRIVTVGKPVNRIIAVYSNVAEAIRALGAKDRVIGVDCYWLPQKYPSFFPEMSKMPCVSCFGGGELDIESILEFEPDMVILPEWHTPDLEDKLKGTGIDVVRVTPCEIETLRNEVMPLGYILDEVENARNYFEWYDGYVDEIKEKVSGIPEDEKTTVFTDGMETGILERENLADHFTTWKPAGGKSIADVLPGEHAPMVEVEWILDQNPDVIIGCRFDGGYKTDDESPYKAHNEEIRGLPGFEQHVSAVRDGRVHVCYARLGMGLQTPIGIAYSAMWLYPDLFEDLDPQAIHQEYIDRFCPGLDFDVSVHGVFVYPKSAS